MRMGGAPEAAGHLARRGRKLRRCCEVAGTLACSAVDGGQLVEKDGMAGRQVAIAWSDGAKDKRPAGFVFFIETGIIFYSYVLVITAHNLQRHP